MVVQQREHVNVAKCRMFLSRLISKFVIICKFLVGAPPGYWPGALCGYIHKYISFRRSTNSVVQWSDMKLVRKYTTQYNKCQIYSLQNQYYA